MGGNISRDSFRGFWDTLCQNGGALAVLSLSSDAAVSLAGSMGVWHLLQGFWWMRHNLCGYSGEPSYLLCSVGKADSQAHIGESSNKAN